MWNYFYYDNKVTFKSNDNYDVVIQNLNKSRDKTDGVFWYKQFKCNNNNVSFQFR